MPPVGLPQISPGRLVLALQRLLDAIDGDLEVLLPEEHAEHPSGFWNLVAGNEITRRLRDREGQPAVDDGGYGHDEEHPAPGVHAEPQWLVGSACGLLQDPVDRERQEDARDDRELLQGTQPASDPGRGGLGDVGRCDHRRDADADAADDAEEHDHPDVRRQCRTEGADEEQHRGDLHHRDASDAVGDPSGRHGTRGGTEQGGRDGEPQLVVVDAEVFLDGIDRAVDDGAVVAEQQAAEGGHRRDPNCGPTRREVLVRDRQVVTCRCTTLSSHEHPLRSAARLVSDHDGTVGTPVVPYPRAIRAEVPRRSASLRYRRTTFAGARLGEQIGRGELAVYRAQPVDVHLGQATPRAAVADQGAPQRRWAPPRQGSRRPRQPATRSPSPRWPGTLPTPHRATRQHGGTDPVPASRAPPRHRIRTLRSSGCQCSSAHAR